MSREITIVTPENVPVTYELAGIGSRLLALYLDTLIQAAAIAVVYNAALYHTVRQSLDVGPAIAWVRAQSGWVLAAAIIAAFLVLWGYFVVFEAAWNGQTPGKKAMRLRVVREGGQPIDLTCSAIRNLMRYVDFMPILYMVGLLSVFFSPRYKRLGDYAAGTIVVKERRTRLDETAPTRTEPIRSVFEIGSMDLLTPEDLAAVRRFVERRSELPLDVQEEVARKIGEPLAAKLGCETTLGRPLSYADLLEAVYAQDRERHRFR